MTDRKLAKRIPEEQLAEHWFAFMHRLMGKLQQAFLAESRATGLTQQDIADRLGKSPSFISRRLRGQQNMTIRTMHDMARAMGCRLDVDLRPLRSLQPANRPSYLDARPTLTTPPPTDEAPPLPSSFTRPEDYEIRAG